LIVGRWVSSLLKKLAFLGQPAGGSSPILSEYLKINPIKMKDNG
jgi:hypothetical protein